MTRPSRNLFMTVVIVFLAAMEPVVAQEAPPPIDSSLAGSSEYQAQQASKVDTASQSSSTSSDSSSSTKAGLGVPTNIADAEALVKTCTDAQATASKGCGDPNSTAGLSGAGKTQMVAALAAASLMGAKIAAAQGSATACLLASGLSGTLQTLALLKGGACSKTQTTCSDTCANVKKALNEAYMNTNDAMFMKKLYALGSTVDTATTTCASYSSNQIAIMAQYQTLLNTAQTAATCAANSKSVSTTATPVSLTTAVGDCSDASYAATSTYCICKANPSDALCTTGSSTASTTSTGGLAAGSVTTPGVTSSSADDGQVVDSSSIGAKPESGKTVGGSGGSGASGGSSGGAGGLNPEGGDGTGASGIDKNVITGASGSSGGLAGLSGGGGGGGGSASKAGGLGGGAGGGGFNLSKYLPKSMFKNRGLAGMTVPAQDGVTGPLGPSIWEKVHTRYEDKKASLIQDK